MRKALLQFCVAPGIASGGVATADLAAAQMSECTAERAQRWALDTERKVLLGGGMAPTAAAKGGLLQTRDLLQVCLLRLSAGSWEVVE